MNTMTKIVLVAVLLFVVYAVYILMPSEEIGSFEKIRAGGEINQSVNVRVVKEKGFERDRNGNIVSFFIMDNSSEIARVSFSEAAPANIATAEVVKLLGHMHDDNFVAKSVEIIK